MTCDCLIWHRIWYNSDITFITNYMKKTGFIWVVIVVLSLYFLVTIISVASRLINPSSILLLPGSSTTLFIIGLFISILAVVITGIFTYKLYKMSTDVIKWAKIAFGYSVLSSLLEFVFTYINRINIPNFTVVIIFGVIITIVTIIIWIIFINHLKKVTDRIGNI